MKKSIQIIEHTPILNSQEYEKRQKKIKFARFRKNFFESMAALCTAMFTFSLFYFGGR